MKTRLLVLGGIVLLFALGVAMALPKSHYLLLGLVRRESYYRGWPTSYWVGSLRKDRLAASIAPPGDIGSLLAHGGADAVPVLCDMLQSDDREVRNQALLALKAMNPAKCRQAAGKLTDYFLEEDYPRDQQLAALILLSWDREVGIQAITRKLEQSPELHGRGALLVMLGDTGSQAPETLGVLRHALDDRNERVRVYAARALWQLTHDLHPVLPALLAGLEADDDVRTREMAARVLAGAGPPAQEAIPDLVRLLKADSLGTREMAISVLGQLGDPAAVPALLTALEDNKKDLALTLVTALSHFPMPQVARALPGFLKQNNRELKLAVLKALAGFGPAAKDALPEIRALTRSKDPIIQAAARKSVQDIERVLATGRTE